jgi:hypothetical protein
LEKVAEENKNNLRPEITDALVEIVDDVISQCFPSAKMAQVNAFG